MCFIKVLKNPEGSNVDSRYDVNFLKAYRRLNQKVDYGDHAIKGMVFLIKQSLAGVMTFDTFLSCLFRRSARQGTRPTTAATPTSAQATRST